MADKGPSRKAENQRILEEEEAAMGKKKQKKNGWGKNK